MNIDLSRLLDRTVYKIDFDQTLELGEIVVNQRELKLVGPVRIKGDVYKTDDGTYLSADITYEYFENCARCLKEFTDKVQTVLSGRLMEKSKSFDQQNDDELIFYYDGDEVELREQAIAAIMLSLPMKSLCDKACKGLCPNCGKDLNEGQCDCLFENIDPRLAKLKDLFD